MNAALADDRRQKHGPRDTFPSSTDYRSAYRDVWVQPLACLDCRGIFPTVGWSGGSLALPLGAAALGHHHDRPARQQLSAQRRAVPAAAGATWPQREDPALRR